MIDQLNKIVSEFRQSEFGVSLSLRKAKQENVTFLNGKKEESLLSDDLGIMVEISKNGKVLRYGVPHLTEETIKKTINYLIQKFDQLSPFFLNESSYQLHKGEIVELKEDQGVSNEIIFQSLEKASSIDNSWIENVRASLLKTNEERIIVNSAGGLFHDRKVYTDFFHNLIGSKGGIVQNRSNGGMVFQGSLTANFLDSIIESKNVLTDELAQLLVAPVCPKFVGELLLPPDQMYIQIHESIGHPLELDRILGDERNYAGGSFVKKEDFGKLKYGTEKMNVFFGPGIQEQPVAQKFDDTGHVTEKIFLIKNGILQAGIGGFESQKRMGVKGSFSTRSCNWNRPPIDRMGNINLAVGDNSFEEMVTSIENGILMKTNKSWSIDDQRDKFQFGCEIGYLIKDGEIKNVVRSPNYEGRTTKFWNSLKMVGNLNTLDNFGTSNCGKGEPNQAIRVGHQSPTCLFENISIFPGE